MSGRGSPGQAGRLEGRTRAGVEGWAAAPGWGAAHDAEEVLVSPGGPAYVQGAVWLLPALLGQPPLGRGRRSSRRRGGLALDALPHSAGLDRWRGLRVGPKSASLGGRGEVGPLRFRREAKTVRSRGSALPSRVLVVQVGTARAAAKHAVETQVRLKAVRVPKRPPAVPANVALFPWARKSGKATRERRTSKKRKSAPAHPRHRKPGF